MRDRQPAAAIGLDQGEGGGRHFERRIVGDRANQGAGEGRLAGAEAPRQQDRVARPQAGGDILGKGGGRGFVGEVDEQLVGIGRHRLPIESAMHVVTRPPRRRRRAAPGGGP